MTRINGTLFTLTALCCLAASVPASAEVFKSVNECVVGKRVTDGSNKSGKIASVDGVLCHVALDEGGSPHAYIFWMLRNEGASAETDDKLVPGRYACYAGRNYTFMDIVITGANSYETKGGSGKFHVEPSRKIVFESGPLKTNGAKLTRGPNIDINSDGGSFYGTTCSYQKK